jgi:hypothetical protein
VRTKSPFRSAIEGILVWRHRAIHLDRFNPNVRAGVQYVIKEKEGMVLNLEYAKGKSDNQGVYLKFGYGF